MKGGQQPMKEASAGNICDNTPLCINSMASGKVNLDKIPGFDC